MKNVMIKTFILALLLMMPLALSGCETVKGAGRDLQKAGQAMDDAL
jgi:predicted small secreted protein